MYPISVNADAYTDDNDITVASYCCISNAVHNAVSENSRTSYMLFSCTHVLQTYTRMYV